MSVYPVKEGNQTKVETFYTSGIKQDYEQSRKYLTVTLKLQDFIRKNKISIHLGLG